MERLKAMKEKMIGVIQCELSDLSKVDAKELGEAIDFVKDCAETEKLCREAHYFETIVRAMEERGGGEYATPMMYPEYPDPMGRYYEHMDKGSSVHRENYMKTHDKKVKMEELEKYLKELAKEITEMTSGAAIEETTLLKQKLTTLIEKMK